jgi:hypothetical protein
MPMPIPPLPVAPVPIGRAMPVVLSPSLERALARTFATPPAKGGYAQLTITLTGQEFEIGQRITPRFTFGAYAAHVAGSVEAGARMRLEWGGK